MKSYLIRNSSSQSFSYIIRQVFLGTFDLTLAGGSKGYYQIGSQMFTFHAFAFEIRPICIV